MGRNITDWKKRGYFYGIEDYDPHIAMKIFCKRRSSDVVKELGNMLSYDDMLARIYYQGLKDGEDIFHNNEL